MSINEIIQQRIFLSPLNWGLGHVSRAIPIIDELLSQKNEIIIFCNAEQEQFYRLYFPQLWYVPHQGYPFDFKGKGKWELDILRSFYSLNRFLKEEEFKVSQWVQQFQPDLILSDQRFGFYSKEVKSIFISHQLNLPVSNWKIVAKWWNKYLIHRFDKIWVPDDASEKLSGELSDGLSSKKEFIGYCSRFNADRQSFEKNENYKYEYLGIISGPEPYNEQLLELIYRRLTKLDVKTAIIAPERIGSLFPSTKQVEMFFSPSDTQFVETLKQAKTVISRNGYSMLMDLKAVEKPAILIPTPGQNEQEYLAKYHHNSTLWKFVDEAAFLTMKL